MASTARVAPPEAPKISDLGYFLSKIKHIFSREVSGLTLANALAAIVSVSPIEIGVDGEISATIYSPLACSYF